MMALAGALAAVPAVMLRNVRPVAPMVVVATLSAVPVVVVNVLTMVPLFCVAEMTPPPVAVKALFATVDKERPPVKATVAPLVVMETPPFVLLTAPENVIVPPVTPDMLIGPPATVDEMVPA